VFTGTPGSYTVSLPLVRDPGSPDWWSVDRVSMSSQGHVVFRAYVGRWTGYLWKSNTGQLVELPFEAYRISADGSWIVGWVPANQGSYGVLWENGRLLAGCGNGTG